MRALAMAVVAVAVVVLVGGCAAGTTGTGESTHAPPPGTDGPVAGAAKTGETCNGTELLTPADGFAEVRGTSEDAELWGLLFAEVPFEAGAEVKIVWRMTGDGPLKVSATGPGGKRAKLVWLEDHGGSNWRRPGYEWGTGWVFPAPGCWKVELSRTRGSGHAWLRVA
ncbi:hypothetical protein [Nonomuraea sp. C10]|uniref:hypothetical protein n=1 Tax=Nonomuraea sp. C10 TaxID=2600577 RepID=UPI0011CE8831|nr:hypothetical protein [Nonomuraea sp. C10]TXK43198.1 hypothetical protein FR742_29730 [Nonomuraea sp. C10]